jgi:hypothetical protein
MTEFNICTLSLRYTFHPSVFAAPLDEVLTALMLMLLYTTFLPSLTYIKQ